MHERNQHGHHPNLGLPSFGTNLGTVSAGYQGPRLGNFHFSQPRFDLPTAPLNMNAPVFTMPELGASSGFAPSTHLNVGGMSGYSPSFFSPPPSLASLPPIDQARLSLSADLLKESVANPHPVLRTLDLVLDAAANGKALKEGIDRDLDAGKSLPAATVCNTLGIVAQSGTDFFLKSAVVSTVLEGMEASAGFIFGGVATANPALLGAGVTSGLAISQMALPAYQAADRAAEATGVAVKEGCYQFEQAVSMARGSRQ